MIATIAWWGFYSWGLTWISCKGSCFYTEESVRHLNEGYMIVFSMLHAIAFAGIVFLGIKELCDRICKK